MSRVLPPNYKSDGFGVCVVERARLTINSSARPHLLWHRALVSPPSQSTPQRVYLGVSLVTWGMANPTHLASYTYIQRVSHIIWSTSTRRRRRPNAVLTQILTTLRTKRGVGQMAFISIWHGILTGTHTNQPTMTHTHTQFSRRRHDCARENFSVAVSRELSVCNT